MQFQDVLKQLNTLPSTYLRPGQTFAMLQASKAAALYRYASASDGITAQVQNFANATGVWLDAWGKLFGVARNLGETDDAYRSRITATLIGGHITPVAIELYLTLAFSLTGTVVEDLTHTAWHLQLDAPLTLAQFQQLINNLKYVRPAGVPAVAQNGTNGGLFLGSVNYLGAPRTTGAYLKTPLQTTTVNISAYTNNAKPLLPTTFMSDPTINPGLA